MGSLYDFWVTKVDKSSKIKLNYSTKPVLSVDFNLSIERANQINT